MSIVGPRPALPAEVATYDDCQRQRLLVKPGMTCYWQTRRNCDSITFDEWVDLDLWRHIDEVALRLVEAGAADGALDEPEGYFEFAGEARLSKTHGRRVLGCINDLSRMLDLAWIDMGERLQWREMELFNCGFISKCVGHEGYGVPAERFAEDLQALIG